MVTVDTVSRHTVILSITGDRIWILDPSMSNGAMPPREFPGLGHLLGRIFTYRMVFIWFKWCRKV